MMIHWNWNTKASTLFLNKSLLLLGLPCLSIFLYIVGFNSIIYFHIYIYAADILSNRQPASKSFDLSIININDTQHKSNLNIIY